MSWWIPTLTALTVVAGNAIVVAVNATTDPDGRWPLWLDGVRRHPFPWAAGFTLLVIFAGLVVWWWGQRRSARRPVVVKLRRCPPGVLGIRPAVAADGAAEGRSARLTRYVPRDHDAALRERLAAVARTGGFVLLVGAAGSGKTRSAYEAVRAVLPKWRLMLVDPARGAARLTEVPPRTILWLDGIQRYLAGSDGGLTRGDLLTLIHRHRAVIVATLWPDHHQALAQRPGRDESRRCVPGVDSAVRDLLALAGQPIHVPERLSEPERQRAARAAAADPRVRAALGEPDVGFAQALTGAAELVRHWRQADRYARAVIDAAVDCRRLGVYGPLDSELLRACASALLTVTPQTASVPGWFDRALDYATRAPRGSTGVLVELPRPRRGWRRRGGPPERRYQLADQVFQYGLRQRFGETLSEHFLKTLVTRVNDGRDLFRVAHSLHARGLHSLAEQLYRRGARAGDPASRRGLALLLEEQGEVAEAVALLDPAQAPGDPYSHLLRLRILSDNDDAATLAGLATTDLEATWRLVALLVARGDHDAAVTHLDRLWRAGVFGAAAPLAGLLAGTGRYDELAELAAADCIEASLYLLASEDAVTWRDSETGRAARAAARAQSRHPYGDPRLRREWLAMEVAENRVDEALAVLRELAAFGESAARRQLGQLLHELGRADELRALAEEGDRVAGWLLADLLASQGRSAELRGLAAHGNVNARSVVATGLARQGQAAEAARWLDLPVLARLLLAEGHAEAARRYAAPLGASAAPGDRLLWARILAATGNREQAVALLTVLTAAGEVAAGEELVAIALAAGSESELRRLACCGVVAARRALLDHLVRVGRTGEADRIRVHGLHPDGSTPQ